MAHRDPEARKAYERAYRALNRDKILARRNAWKEANKERLQAQNKEYRVANKEKAAAQKKEYYAENKERINARSKAYAKANPEVINKSCRKWRAANPAKQKAATYAWRDENRGAYNALCARSRGIRSLRVPEWLSDDCHWLIKEVYSLAELRTKMLGFPWHVDHIVPLQGKKVSGLHVPWNMQVIPAVDNLRKKNFFEVANA